MSAEFKFGTFAGDETVTFDVKSEEQLKPGEVLHAVYAALREKGYNPINQLDWLSDFGRSGLYHKL